ncbi:PulJ/GspJ family protein [Sporohalobacter salinus]|uniref:PulJ/GspJ family protein n=1 Tax=Sporohalobacter salinus TaxID=1494606 RepID=UPI00196161A0|nr:type II secretion system protein [Sporohalobacter salinus]MBM7622736.1 prepilin-type N-terminal cleavage/methylation domain-containing protein [Sporohalobacter salinus]
MLENYDNERAFTLIEILIVLAIVGVVGAAISNVLLTGMNVRDFNRQQVDLQQSGRGVMIRLEKDIRAAEEARVEDANGMTGGQLVLRFRDLDNDVYHYARYVFYDSKLGWGELNSTDTVENNDIWDTDQDEWPTNEDWNGHRHPLTAEIIAEDDYNDKGLFEYDLDFQTVEITLYLELGDREYNIINTAHLRLPNR